jgi:hypothetical protein
MTITVGELARVVTSKNAGPYSLTVDVFFDKETDYRRVKVSGAVTKQRIAAAYGLGSDKVRVIAFSDAALGLKITMDREISADDFRSTDTYGSQHHMPIVELVVEE